MNANKTLRMLANPLRIKTIGYDILAIFFVVRLAPGPAFAATRLLPAVRMTKDEWKILTIQDNMANKNDSETLARGFAVHALCSRFIRSQAFAKLARAVVSILN